MLVLFLGGELATMPRYHFDVTDGFEERDLIGTELASDQVMRSEALRFVDGLLSEEPLRLGLGALWTLVVRVEEVVVLRIDIQN